MLGIREKVGTYLENLRTLTMTLKLDDINDSGKTFTEVINVWTNNNLGDIPLSRRIKTASLVERKGSKFSVDFSPLMLDVKDWVVFPWESSNV